MCEINDASDEKKERGYFCFGYKGGIKDEKNKSMPTVGKP